MTEEEWISALMLSCPPDFKPDIRTDGGRCVWVPPVESACRGLGFDEAASEADNTRLRAALRASAWQVLETERITGRPPEICR